jgi:hypothetical protein
MSRWRSVWDDPPDWKDAQKRIAVKKGVEEKLGRLDVDSQDDVPIFEVRFDDGATASIYDFEEWRLAENLSVEGEQ